MRHPGRLLIVAGVLLAIAFGADRLAAHVAVDRIASAVKSDAHLAQRPRVSIKGFPFLVQAARGRYNHIAISADDIFGTGGSLPTVLRLDFFGVHIPASNALSGTVHRIPVDMVGGVAVIPFSDLQSAAHVAGLSGLSAAPASPNEVLFTETFTVVGVKVDVQVHARVTVSKGSVVVTARNLTAAGGSSLPVSVTNSLLSRAAFSVKLPGLPTGVGVTGVQVTSTGLLVSVSATGLVLTH